MKFVIDRKTWRRGGSFQENFSVYGGTYLLNDKGYMCCLGHIARQCGVPDDEIFQISQPNGVSDAYKVYRSLLTKDDANNDLALDAMWANDKSCISDAEREQMLTRLFAEHGHELEFVQ